MKFYLNEHALLEAEGNDLDVCVSQIHEITSKLEKVNCELHLKDSLWNVPKIISLYKDSQKYYPFIALLGQLNQFMGIAEINSVLTISPGIEPLPLKELFHCCLRDRQEQIISLECDKVAVHDRYSLDNGQERLDVANVLGSNNIDHFLAHNPPCKNMTEVMDRILEKCPHIAFTTKAYKTAEKRNEVYRSFGYARIIDMFLKVEELLYPFFKGSSRLTQEQMEDLFYQKTKIRFSGEDTATMEMFGDLREVVIDGVSYEFFYHLKPGDNRVYLEYIPEKDKIFIGHAGGHPKSVKHRH